MLIIDNHNRLKRLPDCSYFWLPSYSVSGLRPLLVINSYKHLITDSLV
jgi:hypothetical protein